MFCARLSLEIWSRRRLIEVLSRDATDKSVPIEQMRLTQQRLGGRIESASFDRGFHTPENQTELAKLVPHPCLPKPGAKQPATTVEFREARQRHSGVESAIGALQSGNGLKRCRDRSQEGFRRYIALGILGRNLHVLGKLLIAREQADCVRPTRAARPERRPRYGTDFPSGSAASVVSRCAVATNFTCDDLENRFAARSRILRSDLRPLLATRAHRINQTGHHFRTETSYRFERETALATITSYPCPNHVVKLRSLGTANLG